jgi:hypothetical protein
LVDGEAELNSVGAKHAKRGSSERGGEGLVVVDAFARFEALYNQSRLVAFDGAIGVALALEEMGRPGMARRPLGTRPLMSSE